MIVGNYPLILLRLDSLFKAQVRVLHFLVLKSGRGSGESAEDNKFVRVTRKVLGMHPILSIIYGMVMTYVASNSELDRIFV